MATASQSQKPSPERIFGVLNAFQSSAALKTAIELDVFTVIADGAHRAEPPPTTATSYLRIIVARTPNIPGLKRPPTFGARQIADKFRRERLVLQLSWEAKACGRYTEEHCCSCRRA